jgi:O-antigen/teichoic acid export membrane protein
LEFIVIRKKLYHISSLNYYVKGSVDTLKSLSPFALSVAYGAILWLFITQIDKLMLSHYLPLKEYGFFSIIVVVANAVMLMFQPIGQAIFTPKTIPPININIPKDSTLLYSVKS